MDHRDDPKPSNLKNQIKQNNASNINQDLDILSKSSAHNSIRNEDIKLSKCSNNDFLAQPLQISQKAPYAITDDKSLITN